MVNADAICNAQWTNELTEMKGNPSDISCHCVKIQQQSYAINK